MAEGDGWLYPVVNVGPDFDDDGSRMETAIERWDRLNGVANSRSLTVDERHILDDALAAAKEEHRRLNPPAPLSAPTPPRQPVTRKPVESKPAVADTAADQGAPDIRDENQTTDNEAMVCRAPTQSVARNTCGVLTRRRKDSVLPSEAVARADPPPADAQQLRELQDRVEHNEPTDDGDPHPTHGYPFSRWPASAADPVDLFSGAFTLSAVDLVVPATPSDIAFERCYRSGPPYYGPFGYSWDHGFNIYIRQLNDGRIALWTGRLREQYFLPTGALAWRCEPVLAATIEPLPSPMGGFLVTHPQGVTWRFERPSGWPRPDRIPLVAVGDRHGNVQTLTYETSGRLQSILDEGGRGLLFTYGACGLLERVSDHTLTRVVRYEHHPETEQLAAVILPATGAFPNGIVTRYDYDLYAAHSMMRHNILRITNSAGQVALENDYAGPEAGWAFNSVIAQRVGDDEFRFAYEQIQWVPPLEEFVNDIAFRTTVSRPDGALEFYTFNFRGDLLDHRFRLVADKTWRVIATERRFDAQGNVVETIAPDGVRTVYSYVTASPDPRARRNLSSVTLFAAAAATPQSRLVQQISYDPTYQLRTLVIDEDGNETKFVYDFDLGDPSPTGLLKKIIHPPASLPGGSTQTCEFTFEHDPHGRLTALVSPTGSRTELEYAAAGPHQGFLTQVTRDALGPAPHTTSIGYGPTGFPAFVEEPGGARTDTTVNGIGQVEQVDLPLVDGARVSVRISLAETGVPIATELPRGGYAEAGFSDSVIIDRLEVDVLGRVTAVNTAANTKRALRTGIELDHAGRPVAILDPLEVWTVNRYDERGLLLREIAAAGEPEEAVTRFGYDRAGRLDWVSDPVGRTTRVELRDDWGRPARIRLPRGTIEELVWGKRDLLLERKVTGSPGPGESDRLLSRETYSYDQRARPTVLTVWSFRENPATAIPLAATTFYDAEDRPTKILFPRGGIQTLTYDGLGQLVETVDTPGHRRNFEYDVAGNLSAVVEIDLFGAATRSRRTTFDHDARRRLRRMQGPGSALELDYDDRSLVTEQREAGAVTTRFAYGPHGEIDERLLDPGGLALRSLYLHDGRGDVIAYTDPANETTRWQRDALGRSKRAVLPDGSDSVRSFDPLGRVLEARRASSVTLRYSYGPTAAGPLRVTATSPPGVAPAGPYEYAYDGLERLVLAKDPSGEVRRRYDSLDRLFEETALGKTIAVHSNDVTGSTELTFPDGRRERIDHDQEGRPTGVTLVAPGSLGGVAGGAICSLAFGGPSRLTSIACGNGVASTFAYDDAGRLMALDVSSSAGPLDGVRLAHDDRGRRAFVQRMAPAGAVLHGYDKQDRLVRARWGAPMPPLAPDPSPQQQALFIASLAGAPAPDGQAYELDAADVRKSRTRFGAGGGTDLYTRLSGARIGAVNGVPISYDADGQRVEDGRLAYDVDALGRVTVIRDSASNAVLATFSYDGLSRPSQGTLAGASYCHWFLGDQPIEQRATPGGPAKRQWTPHPLWELPIRTAETGGESFIHADGGYSSLCVTNAAGALIERHRFGPFGEAEILGPSGSGTGQAPAHGAWWRAMPLLPGPGLYQTPRRLYDPATGAFLARDPWLYGGSPNAYAFAGHNPVDFFDPLGRDSSPLDDDDWDDDDQDGGSENRLGRPPATRDEDWFRRWDNIPGQPLEKRPLVQKPSGIGGVGFGLRYGSPPRFTLKVPDSYDQTKLEAYNRAVLQKRIGRNAGTGANTSARRETPMQRAARREFWRRMRNAIPARSPLGNKWQPDHIIELQHDLWGTSGNIWSDYRPQDGPLNMREGSQSWHLQKSNPFRLPAGATVRESEAGRWYNSVNFRRANYTGGTLMTAYGIYESGKHIQTAFYADAHEGTMGQQTMQAIAEEAGGWAAAIAMGTEGAALGAVCGPAAWLCVPVFGLIGGGLGYYAGSGTVRTTTYVGTVGIDLLMSP